MPHDKCDSDQHYPKKQFRRIHRQTQRFSPMFGRDTAKLTRRRLVRSCRERGLKAAFTQALEYVFLGMSLM